MNSVDLSVRSVMPRGNGAFIVHAELADTLPRYELTGCNPYLAAIPGLPHPRLRQWLGGAAVVHLSPGTGHVPLSGRPFRIQTFHSFDVDPANIEQASAAQRLYYRHVLRPAVLSACSSADRIIAVSRFVADNIYRHQLAGSKKVEVIYNGIDTRRFCPGEAPYCERPLRILFVGNPSRRKGFHLLPALADALTGEVEIAFTTGLRDQQVQSRHPHLISLGSVPYSEMHVLYQQADILLFPAYREGFGLCVAEAMSCGLPVISTKCSAIPELVIDGRGGFLVDPGDFPAMVEKISVLAKDIERRREMGAWNRERALKLFDRERMANDYRTIFAA